MQASYSCNNLHCEGCSLQWFSHCRAQALGCVVSVVVVHRLSCPMTCGIFLDRGLNGVPCIARQIINHWTTREVPQNYFYTGVASNRRRQWHPTPVLLPGRSHGWMSLVGCGPWGRKELDTTERLHFHFSLLCIGKGNGNPLQCSCLENPRDRGAWWAAVYGVAQSLTQLK